MSDKSVRNECADPTQQLTVDIPCRLAERIEAYARQTGTSMTQVMIEALDGFLREKMRLE
ncbi:MAG: hypothetical protein PVG78_14065 [Desulfobacterales bacterium]